MDLPPLVATLQHPVGTAVRMSYILYTVIFYTPSSPPHPVDTKKSPPGQDHRKRMQKAPPLLLAAHWAAAAVQVPPAAVVGPPLPPILLTLDPLLLYILTPLTPRPRGELCPPVGGDAGWHANRATHRIYVNAAQGLPIKSLLHFFCL